MKESSVQGQRKKEQAVTRQLGPKTKRGKKTSYSYLSKG
jgi:hypothetical protein